MKDQATETLYYVYCTTCNRCLCMPLKSTDPKTPMWHIPCGDTRLRPVVNPDNGHLYHTTSDNLQKFYTAQ